MNKEEVISILSGVMDPEIPVLSIGDLGILRDVAVTGDKIFVQITPTYSGCPAMKTIREDILSALGESGLKNVEISEVLSPAWTTAWMSETGKDKLRAYGIAAPSGNDCHLNGNDLPDDCPHCHSRNVEMISRFGSTSCKALYRCLDCQEPFDYFKCH
jgi:ring-1,2-phenylacetyl-CoA epoxidase subunit PaaD